MVVDIFQDEDTLKNCKIYQMLRENAEKKHISFHMPGHKKGAWDITELSFSDNLSDPQGCIAEAEKDIASILGAARSFILTNGSTSGVLSMLYVAAACGVKTIAVCEDSHKSVFNGCSLLGITPLLYPQKTNKKIPFAYTMYELNEEFTAIFQKADALLFTSPDYYGNVADLSAIRAFCDREGKLLLIDGAHGGHLHYQREIYAGAYADLWVDGAHKTLPCFTQSAVVSARTEALGVALRDAAGIFRTTSPSYPIMASVEYAVKYPRNEELEKVVVSFMRSCDRIYTTTDWTKLCALFGRHAFAAQKELEEEGIYSEFCDGNIVMFYLSPMTQKEDFYQLTTRLSALFEKYPYQEEKEFERIPAPLVSLKNTETEWVELDKTIGRICANPCGLFPPCLPLLHAGERVTEEKVLLLQKAVHVYGLVDGKMQVLKNEKEE